MAIQSKVKSLILTIIIVMGAVVATAQNADRPNIILIMTDQHQAEALSITGNTDLKTPNLDKLAESGIRFEKAYVTFPLCIPSRSSIFTGKMPHNLSVYSNKEGENVINASGNKLMLGAVLTEAGYDCAYGGKWHVREDDMVEGNGFEMIAPKGDIGLAEKSIEYLKSKKDSEKPFFLTVSFDNPHNICEWARNQPLPYGNIPNVTLDKTPQLPKNYLQSATFPEVLKIEQNANKSVYPTANYTDEDWRNYRHAYYSLVEKVDTEIGKIINAVDALNLRKNTLIIFTSDHGDGNASHGWNQKTALIEESIKVPFIASYKGKIKNNKVSKTLISNGLDLYPTICDYANVEIPNVLRGESLKPVFEGKKNTLISDYVVVETKFAGEQAYGTIGRAVVGQKYKYAVYNWGKNREQLFDLENDPLELNNLATSKKHLKILDEYRSYLLKWCKQTNDNKFFRRLVLPSTSTISSIELFKNTGHTLDRGKEKQNQALDEACRWLYPLLENKKMPDLSETLMLDKEVLRKNKQQISANNPVKKAALNTLLNTADKILKAGRLYSVMNKNQTPPSGDKHDYMSTGPYWWPDPTKSDGLPYIRKDGQRNPEYYKISDKKEINYLINNVEVLALSYYYTRNEKYAEYASKLLNTWFINKETRQNPNLNFGQGIPGINTGRGIGIIDTRQLYRLIDGSILLKGSKNWESSQQHILQDWFAAYLRWLMESYNGKDESDAHNNHGTYYSVQVINYALFTGNIDVAKKEIERVKNRMNSQFKPNGSQPFELERTKSWNYVNMNLWGFCINAKLAEHVNQDLWHYQTPKGAGIRTCVDWIIPFLKKEKEWPYEQIEKQKYEETVRILKIVSKKYADQAYDNLAKKADEKYYLSALNQLMF